MAAMSNAIVSMAGGELSPSSLRASKPSILLADALADFSDCESDAEREPAEGNYHSRQCGSITCSTRSTSSYNEEGESLPNSDCERESDVVDQGQCSSVSTPEMFPVYQPSGIVLQRLDLDGVAPLYAECDRWFSEQNSLRANMPSQKGVVAKGTNSAERSLHGARKRATAQECPLIPGEVTGSKGTADPSSNSVAAANGHLNDMRTTVMWRNLPNNYTRAMLLRTLDDRGFSGLYDFVYMPMDFKTRASLGYAFINLVEPDVVSKFWQQFDGFSRWSIPSKKASYVSWSDPHQGWQMNVERYRNSPVMHDSVPDEYKPVVFANGVRISFPAPARKPRAPRYRQD